MLKLGILYDYYSLMLELWLLALGIIGIVITLNPNFVG